MRVNVEAIRYLYYVNSVEPFWHKSSKGQRTLIRTLQEQFEVPYVDALKLKGQFLDGDFSLDLVLKARYNWVKKAKELQPRLAIYETQKGPIFAVYSFKEKILAFKRGACITNLECTPDLRKDFSKETFRIYNQRLREFEIQSSIDALFLREQATKL